MLKLNNIWLYKIEPVTVGSGLSLRMYSQKINDYMHLRYLRPHKVKDASVRYEKTMRYIGCHPQYLKFSIQNLIEISKNDNCITHFYDSECEKMKEMVADVCKILDIEIEVSDKGKG